MYRERSSYRRYPQENVEPLTASNPSISFQKNFYKPTETMSQQEAEEMRKNAQMVLNGNDINLPVSNFTSLGFNDEVLGIFRKNGYDKPTPIQAQGWPMALSGRDMVGVAQTGSGKTLSFMLPALVHASAQESLRNDDGPIVLVLAPTRELCKQIEEVAAEYSPIFNLKTLSVYGGAPMVPQKRGLKRGVEILVATPGRLIDLHEQGFCPLSRVSFLVLDEADRMLDMGFEPQLNKIIPKTNSSRQTLMWSATWPKEVRSLAVNYMKDYIQVTIGSENLKANSLINQAIDFVEWRDKKSRLLARLGETQNRDKIIIFCNKISTCDDLEDYLYDKRYNAVAIHGKKRQNQRDEIIRLFKEGHKNILIATDVAARGLDVQNVLMVINFDFPNNIEEYVHRIGRTARGKATEGKAVTFFSRDDTNHARKLVEILQDSKQEVPKELHEMKSTHSSAYNNRSRYGSRPYNDRGNSRSYDNRSNNYRDNYNGRRSYY